MIGYTEITSRLFLVTSIHFLPFKMSFTEASTSEIQSAFNRASKEQPAGAPRIGQLEITILTGMVEEFAGVDDEGEAMEYWVDRLDPTSGAKDLEVVVNGRSATIRTFLFQGRCNGSISLLLEGFGYYLVGEGSDTFFEHDNVRPVVEAMFSCLQEDYTCATCGRVMVDDGKVYCAVCKTHWDEKGCSICGKRVGKLTDGVHEPCAKKQRTEL